MHRFVLMLMVTTAGLCACSPAPVERAREMSTSTSAVAPVQDSPMHLPGDLVFFSNEPFWRVSIEGSSVVMKGMQSERHLVLQSNDSVFDGRVVSAHDAKGAIEVRITERACQDNMSGADFPYTGKLSMDGGEAIMGCARPASVSANQGGGR